MDLSIIIPTLNRVASLRTTLLSIVAQQSSQYDYEVIVVDNGSSDNTKEACEEAEKHIKNFTYCYDNEPGLLTGRHKGADVAKGTILSFIDDDVELNPGWVGAIISTFRSLEHISIVSGPCLPKYQMYPPSWVNNFWQPTPYGGKMCLPLSLLDIGADAIEIDPLYAFGLNYSIRKEVFVKLGGFHPDRITDELQQYQGDGETGLSIKAKINNYSALYVSSALLHHLVSQERLRIAYFERWYYYSGVCNSFTNIRLHHNLYPTYGEHSLKMYNLLGLLLRRLKNVIKRITESNSPVPKHLSELQAGLDKKFKEGYNFHQQSFLTDEKVKSWVLKPEYWNYKLPT